MKKNKLFQSAATVKFLVGIIVFLLAVSVFWDVQQQQRNKIFAIRNELSFTDLLVLEDRDGILPKVELEKYLRYFLLVAEQDKTQADVHALMGFCYYHLGEKAKAKAAYQQAVILNPKFLNFQYNVAVLDLEDGHYQEALQGFQNALTANPSDNVLFLRNFKNFVYIIYRAEPLRPPLSERIKREYGLSAYFASVCLEQLGDRKKAFYLRQQSQSVGIEEKDVRPRLRIF